MELVLFVLVGLDDAVLELELEEFVSVHRVADAVGELAEADTLRKRDARLFAGAATLGGHVDDTVGCTGTVDRSGGSVLQSGNALDVAVVQHGEGRAGSGRTVDDDEGRVARAERTHTTHADTHVAHFAGIARVGENLQTGYLTLEGVGHVGGGLVGYLLAAYLLHRTDHGADLTGRTVTDNDGFAEFVVLEDYLHIAGNAHGLRFHTDVGNHQFLSGGGHVLELEVTVHVGRSHHLGAIHANGGTGEGLAVGVGYLTRYMRLR